MKQAGWRLLLKRSFDFGTSALGLIATSPILIGAGVAIRATMGSPVLFRQQRGGYRGSRFTVLKFRTMRHATDPDGRPLPDSERLTRLGQFLRDSSIDELPQLWNVLRGEISLVGPRPFIAKYLDLYSVEQARRHDVRPGLTGWAQINGRNALTWPQKFALDLWYVDHWSLALDARILVLTALRVLQRHGLSQQGHATASEFLGETE